jgi:hypothetical protein
VLRDLAAASGDAAKGTLNTATELLQRISTWSQRCKVIATLVIRHPE